MFELTQSYISNVTIEELTKLDLSEFNMPSLEVVKEMDIEEDKMKVIVPKIEAFKMRDGKEPSMPKGKVTFDDDADEVKEYISINMLREKIEEKGVRAIDEGFTFGKKAWLLVFEHLGLGYSDEGTYVFYDDVDDCYKAEHPKSGQIGFNVLCFDIFWGKEMEKILRVKAIVDEFLEEEAKEKARYKREISRKRTARDRRIKGAL